MDWAWLGRNLDDLARFTLDHVVMTVLAVAIGSLISFAPALLIRRRRRLHVLVLGISGVLYAIPSLALFALIVPFTGPRSLLAAEIALVSYTILILVRNFLAGFGAVPADVIEAAAGMGFTAWQRLWRVELPIALPVIMAGLRIATVTTIGLVTVTALIGLGGLGYFILRGMQQFFSTATLIGAVLSMALAIAVDRLLIVAERRITPWTPESRTQAA